MTDIDDAKLGAYTSKQTLDALEEEYIKLKGLSSKEHIEWARKLGKAERDLIGHRDDIRDHYRKKKADAE
jgi:hypothetical protein